MSAHLLLIGLGRIGCRLAQNIRDSGYGLVAWDMCAQARVRARREGIDVRDTLESALAAVPPPRAVLLCLPAGDPVESMLERLGPQLVAGDVLADLGNSHFDDTARRVAAFEARGISMLGVGIAGGESGARYGAAVMAGGSREAWKRISPVLRDVAARVDGRPAAAFTGPAGAGHLAKVAHNAAEYAEMEAIAEVWSFMERLLDLGPEEIARAFEGWNRAEGGSYLLEITSTILRRDDFASGRPALEMLADVAEHTGTGCWAVAAAVGVDLAVPSLAEALFARILSGDLKGRRARAPLWPESRIERPEPDTALPVLEQALLAARIAGLTQAIMLLQAVARARGWRIDVARVLRVWRGGGIVRSPLLRRFEQALSHAARPGGLLAEPWLAAKLRAVVPGLRRTVAFAARAGLPVPVLAASLGFLETLHDTRLPARLVQAQRDYFGGHGVRRVDRDGRFHLDGTRIR